MSKAADLTEDTLRLVVLATLVGGAFWMWTRQANPFPTVGAAAPRRPIRHRGKHSLPEMREEVARMEKARREIFSTDPHDTSLDLREWIWQQKKKVPPK